MIRYAVVGAGWIAQEAFMPAIEQTGNSALAAIVSGDQDKARKLADFYGVERVVGYDAFDALIESSAVDAVYIAVPNPLHATYAIRAAKARKHVMVEKPIATSVVDAQAMIRAARENNVLLMTSYRLHHEAGTVAALDAVRSGRIGEPRHISAIFGFQSQSGNHRLDARHWGGPLQDIGIYCINAARHIFASEPVEAIAMTAKSVKDPRFGEIDEAVSATLRFPGDRLAQFYCSFGSSEIDMYRVVGTEGDLMMEPAFRFEKANRFRLNINGKVETFSYPLSDQFAGQIAYFSDCIRDGTEPEADGEEGLADLRVLLAVEKAAQTGRAQKISSPARTRHPTTDMVRTARTTTRRLLV
ncbi:Gfo/Idh/MocA family oxidoreductase [Mesorhizobium sp. M3A.F.Ca.ET.080.04.2.1]|uniref:Gfo/Idh/MocA family protein n=1 Tax=Mesorhizobium sp. M3A.F.Ca.ET.080.04.2.1 TaxID=2493676 RepID=UPI000F752ED0|nr:Gfo/Idh/MocA family oxidoreductase [Mesorhizobium sp. M3A.F.Ca.ET.080.04.2.1]AZO07840.1 Gfo/Idh/MocA family oxidoreductase [Mesorhizobium sp. M3A.F.Ca.ET.080.04.2.1]